VAGDNLWRAFGAGAAGPVRPQNLIAVAADLHATIAVGAESTFAIERANERIETGELDVEPGPGVFVER
jgi:hypothetical protein